MSFVYILKCSDNTLYTGATRNLEKRVQVHKQARGAKYTRGRLPVELLYFENCINWTTALKRERQIKKLNKQKKLALVLKK